MTSATSPLPVILAINPSHATATEHDFWEGVARAAKNRGWILVELATRLLPYTESGLSISLPARLGDLDHRLQDVPMRLPDWISREHLAILEDWEYRRWQLDGRLPAVLSGLLRLTALVERTLDELRPGIVLTMNKIDHPVDLFRRGALAKGIPTCVVERSPLDGIWLEPDGLFSESRIWQLYPERPLEGPPRADGEDPLKRLRDNPGSFRATRAKEKNTLGQIRGAARPLVFLPMDNVLWTGWEQPYHPMAAIDNPLYPDPFVAMRDLKNQVDRLGGTLVVKKHPACLAITPSTVPPSSLYVEGEIGTFLRESDVVMAFNTKVAFPALAMGKSVVTLAPNPVARSGATYHATSRDEVAEVLEAAVRREDLAAKLCGFEPLVRWLDREYFYRCYEAPDGPTPTNAPYRGPSRFCEDVIAQAGWSGHVEDGPDLQSMTERLTSCGLPPDHTRVRSHVSKRALTQNRRRSLPARALRILRGAGLREFGRRLLLWLLSRFAEHSPNSLLRQLERWNLDVRELKAKFPHAVTYRTSWRGPRPDEEECFVESWDRGLPRGARPHPTGCTRQTVDELRRRFDQYRGGRLTLLLSGTGPDTQNGRKVHIVDDVEALDGSVGDFFSTCDWNRVRCLARLAEEPGCELWLPQMFYGLLPEEWQIQWFGTHPRATSLQESLEHSGVLSTSSPVAATQIGVHLGFRDIELRGPLESSTRSILELLARESDLLRLDIQDSGG